MSYVNNKPPLLSVPSNTVKQQLGVIKSSNVDTELKLDPKNLNKRDPNDTVIEAINETATRGINPVDTPAEAMEEALHAHDNENNRPTPRP